MTLYVPGPAGRLEARLWEPAPGERPRAACVVCHPHPRGGGTMHTTAAYRTGRGLALAGLAVLRFNFRGVGLSAGEHDGKGAEELDLVACLDWMERRYPTLSLWAAGFSFGARTAASRARSEPRIARIVLVALPIAGFDCSFLREVETPGLVLQAERDEFGNLAELKRRFPELYPGLELDEVPGADHFFTDASQEVQERVRGYALRALEGS
jgi:alpha/beta superfamily hydrolase